MLPVTPPKLGRYEIVDEIGKGAMGVVYLARDPLIGRLVALKTFRIGYSVRDQELEQFRIRFMREAQSAGILSHPNIVTIHDVVEQTDEGLAFIAMEYVRGTTLKALLQSDQPMSLAFVVDVVSQIAEALDYAHAHRVIHRDVKPANILITADNKIKITDFGIARLDTSNLTQEGQLLGTPNYMAPEQIQGKEIDHRADLFALGVVLYEMLTRHKPFQGENLTVVSHRIVYDHFTPPKEYAKELPPGVEQVLDRALDKDPARRYQRAKDMADDLRRVLSDSRDDLNETLSIAAWAPGTGPASHPTPPGGTTTYAGLPPPPPGAAGPASAAQAKPPKPKKPRQPLSPRRLMLSAGVAAVVAILAAAALILGITWSGKDVDPAADVEATRYLALMRQGRTELDLNKFMEASKSFREAELLAPAAEKERIRLMRDQTAERAAEYFASMTRTEQIATHMADARIALEDTRYDDAVAAADAVLALDPAHAEATQIRTDAQKGLEVLRRQRRPQTATPGRQPTPGEQIATATPLPVPSSTPEQERATSTDPARLRVVLNSEMPEATVQIRLKGRTILAETFRSGARTKILRRRAAGGVSGERTIQLQDGLHDLQVLVRPGNQASTVVNRSGNFPGGETRTLDIRVSGAGQVSVNLN
ncbi:MAG TPA: serine/threonine-protein kinase [Thermoanaerobaculia bacterium]|nr:serine/threonine-protein kinase [Thermoanaerobaculia bacterium]